MDKKEIIKAVAMGATGFVGYKMIVVVGLKHFKMSEFRGEWVFLASGLLVKLDAFADALGKPVMVSPAKGSMIRWFGQAEAGVKYDQHWFGTAIDVMLPDGPDLQTAFGVAERIGFTGIGVYPDWHPYPGMHLDIRHDREPLNPATWAGILENGKQVYVQVQRGFYA
jgi:hypothetical protein